MFFHFEPLSIPDVIRITPASHACSTRGVLRGLHYQAPPRVQAKRLESATSPFQYVQ